MLAPMRGSACSAPRRGCARACGARTQRCATAAMRTRTPDAVPQLATAAAPARRQAGSRRAACRASSTDQAQSEERARRSNLVKSANTVLAELTGLDFPRTEVTRYMSRAVKAPAKYADVDVARAAAALAAVLAPAPEDGRERTEDTEALVVLNAMLSDMWRWRRRGGFGASDMDAPPHIQALQALQGIELSGDWVTEVDETGERVTSSLLDNLPISDAEKSALGGAVQKVAMGAINGAVWGSLVGILAMLVLFNFVRG